jgi:hypothetical protein
MKTITFEVPDWENRKTYNDFTYFNSDLNKFIAGLPHIMTSIDVDLLQFKRTRDLLRIGEYKHIGEKMERPQREALNELADAFNFLNCNGYKRRMEVVILIGNPPFEKLIIQDLTRGRNIAYEIKGEDVQSYLTLEKDANSLDFKIVPIIY